MAKQRGIHQIKGKINNLCYYEQKYIRGGLIRRINEAMSERLKSDPAFANTRVANTIFGGASMCASVLLEFFSSRATYLFKPYRHAILTRIVLDDLSSSVASSVFPSLLQESKMRANYSYAIDRIVKNKLRDYFPTIAYHYANLRVQDSHEIVIPAEDLEAFCEKNRCIGVQISVSSPHYIFNTNIGSGDEKYTNPDANPGGRVSYLNWYTSNEEMDDLTITADTGDVDEAYTFWIVYATPILSKLGNRPITGKTGASCGVVSFRAL